MMKKLSQKGFTVIEGLLILLIVGIIGGVGWHVHKTKDDTSNTYDNSVNTGEPSKNTIDSFEECKKAGNPIQESYPERCSAGSKSFTNIAQESKDWLQYVAKDGTYKVKLNDGWVIDKLKSSDILLTFNNENLKPKAGNRALVKTVSDGPGEYYDSILFIKVENDRFSTDSSTETPVFNTLSGIKVYRTKSVEDNDGQPLPKGTKRYYYAIGHKNKTFTVLYSVQPGETDYHEEVEKVVQTVELTY